MTQPASPDPGAMGRVVILIAILAVGALWLQHHLGFEFANLGWVTLAALVWGSMGKLADWLGEGTALGQLADRWVKAPLRSLFHHAARPAPLYALGGTLAVLMATVSSVTVRSDGSGDRGTVTLAAFDADRRAAARSGSLSGDDPVVRFLPVMTGPFGRLYQVDADGYLPAQLTIYPLVGRQVLLGRDLASSPSVLFRAPGEGVVALRDGAVFTVGRLLGGRVEPLATSDTGSSAGAFLVGPRRPVSEAMAGFWALELTASGALEAVRAEMLIIWRNPRWLPSRAELVPGDCLLAEIRLHDVLKARAVVPVSDAPLADVLLLDVPAGAAEVTSC